MADVMVEVCFVEGLKEHQGQSMYHEVFVFQTLFSHSSRLQHYLHNPVCLRPFLVTPHISKHTHTHTPTPPCCPSETSLTSYTSDLAKCPRPRQLGWFCVCARVCARMHMYEKNHKISLISQVFLIDRDEIKRRANRDFYLFIQPLKCFYRETDPSSFMCWNNISHQSLFDTNKINYCKNCNQSLTIRTNTLEYDSTETQL